MKQHRDDAKTRSIMIAGVVLLVGAVVPTARGDEPATAPERVPASARAAEFARLEAKAQAEGTVPVIVRFEVPEYQTLLRATVAAKDGVVAEDTGGRLAAAIDQAARAELGVLQGIPHTVNRTYRTLPYVALTVPADALDALEASPGVVDIEEDRLSHPLLNNTVHITGASDSWDLGYDGTGWYVAILDTGIRDTHDFFAGKNIVQACFARGEDGATGAGDCPNGQSTDTTSAHAARHHTTPPNSDHGSWTAGIATGNGPGTPSAGIAKGADLIAIQVFTQFTDYPGCNPPGSDCVMSWSADQLAALDYLFTLRSTYDIASANMSIGGSTKYQSDASCDAANGAMKTAINNLRSAGIATVIAAGNEGYCDGLASPGCISSAVAVGATSDADNEWSGSNYDAEMLELFAPGVDVLSAGAASNSDYNSGTGTSGAAPHVAGAWAILRQTAPDASVDTILAALQTTGAVVDAHCGSFTPSQRRIQIDAALLEVMPSVRSCTLNELVASDAEANAAFGVAVAADEVVAVVGAHQDSCGAGSQCGAAYVYRWSGTSWDEEQKIAASDAAAGDQFGGAVSISGNAAIVGAPKDDRGAQANAGSAYVFRYDGGSWIEEQQLAATVAASGAEFGTAVAIEGDVALVGAPKEAAGGAVYVFRYAAGSWGLEATLTASSAGDGFGTSVSLSGDVAVVGAPSVDCGAGSDCGAAYVYRYSSGAWPAEQTLTASDGQSLDWFGSAVAVDGTQAAVGAPLADCGAAGNCGAVYVFSHSGMTWVEKDVLTAPDAKAGDYMGWSLALRDDVCLTGAYGVDCAEGTNCGAAYFFRSDGGGNWMIDSRLMASDPDGGDAYGRSVALAGFVALIGANGRDSLGLTGSGAVFAYGFPGDCNDNGMADICDILSGYSEDLDGDNRPDECVCVASSPAEPDRLNLPSAPVSRKIRYLSYSAGDAGQSQAIRVTFQNLPAPYAHWNGTRLWVQEPRQYCENAGQKTVPSPSSPPNYGCGASGGISPPWFWAAEVGCDPYWTDWTPYGVVHVWNEGLIPNGQYDIQVIDQTCPAMEESDFSTALTLTQSRWADLIKDCTTNPCGPPDNTTGIVDVTAILDKYKNLPGNVTKARADIEGAPSGDARIPNRGVDITDVTVCLGAFLGQTYPPPGYPLPGNPPSCSP